MDVVGVYRSSSESVSQCRGGRACVAHPSTSTRPVRRLRRTNVIARPLHTGSYSSRCTTLSNWNRSFCRPALHSGNYFALSQSRLVSIPKPGLSISRLLVLFALIMLGIVTEHRCNLYCFPLGQRDTFRVPSSLFNIRCIHYQAFRFSF